MKKGLFLPTPPLRVTHPACAAKRAAACRLSQNWRPGLPEPGNVIETHEQAGEFKEW
jgi:hypothetical protein